MFILVDPNSVDRPMDLYGVLRNFRRVSSIVETQEIDPEEDENSIFQKALNSYRRSSEDEMKKVFTAEDIMTKPVTSLDSKTTLKDVLTLFSKKRYRHVPITHAGKVMNLISDRDVFQIQIDQARKIEPYYDHAILTYIKPKELLCAREKTAIPKIALLMLKKNIGCVPILNDESELIGIVTRSDILRAMVQFGPIDLWI